MSPASSTGGSKENQPLTHDRSVLLTGLGCELDELGWVVHDPVGRTTIAGVWVAGNAADPRAQVISAAGQGSAAAIALNADLVDEDVKHALADHRTGHTVSTPALPFIYLRSCAEIDGGDVPHLVGRPGDAHDPHRRPSGSVSDRVRRLECALLATPWTAATPPAIL
jgi:hypothetical protein